MANLPMPPYDELSRHINYDPDTGVGIWLVSRQGTPAGKVAGCYGHGYCYIKYKQKKYLAHRLFWYLQTKEDPKCLTVDHIDQNKTNNKFCNLRLATLAQQQHNTFVGKNSITGIRGVYWRKSRQKYEANIEFQGKKFFLGSFKTLDKAIAAREAKELELYGEFSPLHQLNNDQRFILDNNNQQLSLLRHPSL